jgi:hypothetical protein
MLFAVPDERSLPLKFMLSLSAIKHHEVIIGVHIWLSEYIPDSKLNAFIVG